MKNNPTITKVPNVLVGHSEDQSALTGCTVVIFPKGGVAGIDQRGGAPGTRETDLLRPMHMVEKVNAILLAGGSAFGLDAASGVVRFLEERRMGLNVRVATVPIVPAAILFDLAVGNPQIRPDASMGYQASCNASTDPVRMGNIGAGTGATVGKILGNLSAMKSGLGSSVIRIHNGIFVGALIAVNAFGDVYDNASGRILAGARKLGAKADHNHADGQFLDTLHFMKNNLGSAIVDFATHQNTIIGCVATNARLSKDEANKVAQMAHNGIAMTVRPAHTMLDGDTLFAVSTGNKKGDVSTIGACAAEAVAESILLAVINAKGIPGVPSVNELSIHSSGGIQ